MAAAVEAALYSQSHMYSFSRIAAGPVHFPLGVAFRVNHGIVVAGICKKTSPVNRLYFDLLVVKPQESVPIARIEDIGENWGWEKVVATFMSFMIHGFWLAWLVEP